MTSLVFAYVIFANSILLAILRDDFGMSYQRANFVESVPVWFGVVILD